jgi:hypothetical protein
MLALPVPSDAIPDGSSDDQLLRLDGIMKEDFEQLLRLVFPVCETSLHTLPQPEFTLSNSQASMVGT